MDADNINLCARYVDDILLKINTNFTIPELIHSHINTAHPSNYLPLSLNTTKAYVYSSY